MMQGLREMGRVALIEGLTSALKEVEWGGDEMALIVNRYLLGLCKHAGSAVLLRLSPLIDFGMDVPDGPASAAQLAAVQGFSSEEFEEVLREAWKQAHDEEPPDSIGYRHFGGEVALQAVRRLTPGGTNI